ncbi:Lsa family ABC-F type ribosomal protection protein, partial [Bifidobacterium longum]|nr:Lsa family ABC-F type ribosomal protection protein [Bifidobacterium longum]
HLYLWDEPLNYLDTYNQQQLIQLIQEKRPPMLIVEHDQNFIKQIATKKIEI